MFPASSKDSDCVHYRVFLQPGDTPSTSELFLARLVGLRLRLLTFAAKEIGSYFWHRDPFNLELCFSSDDTDRFPISIPHLHGSTRFGENLEDEWFIVYLLRKMTATFDDITVRVVDGDGQFLLIEAADALPSWLDPEIADARVFLQKGATHVLPRKHAKAEVSKELKSLTPEFALAAMQGTHGSVSSTFPAIDTAIQSRLSGFPERALAQSSHRVRVQLPHSAAEAFSRWPELLGRAAHLFYYRDAVDLRATRTMKRFGPQAKDNLPMVWTKVRLTRCMFAQLMGQQFHTPKVLLPFYPAHSPDDATARGADLGVKLLCGLEMYYQAAVTRRQKQPPLSTAPITVDSSLSSSALAQACLREMKASVDSLAQTQLIELSQALTRSEKQQSVELEWQLGEQSAATALDEILSHLAAPTAPSSFESLGHDDDESWLAVDPDELDRVLRSKEVVGLEPSDIKGQADILTGESAPSKQTTSQARKKQPTGLIQAATPTEEDPKAPSTSKAKGAAKGAEAKRDAEEKAENNVAAASESLAHVAQGVSDFMGKSSGYKGVVQPQHLSVHSKQKGKKAKEKSDQEVEFDLSKLLAALQGDVQQGAGNTKFNEALKRLGVTGTENLPQSDSEEDKVGEDDEGDGYEGDEGEGNEGDELDIDDIDQENANLRALMQAMDQELHQEGIGKEFERAPATSIPEEPEEFQPVEVNLNLVKNLLESYSSQAGEAGPVGNLLSQLGLSLPMDLPED